jgi:HEAT repeat protein
MDQLRAACVLVLTVLPQRVWGTEPVEEPPDLTTVPATADPVRDLVGRASDPALPEADAQAMFNRVVAMGGQALPSLEASFRDAGASDAEVWIAARALGRIGGERARRALVDGLSSSRIIARLGAVSGLGLLGDRDLAKDLEKALFDEAMTVRTAAADALAALGVRGSSKALSEALDLPGNFRAGKSHFVRVHIIQALGRLGSIGGLDALVRAVGEPEPAIRLAAADALTAITGTTFRPRDGRPDDPPGPAESAAWQQWWSQRSVGTIAE